MFLLGPAQHQHEIADRFPAGNFAFAQTARQAHASCGASPYSKLRAPICQNRYPSPSLRPDPTGVRPLLSRDGRPRVRRHCAADWQGSCRICFSMAGNALKSAAKRTLTGGRAECVIQGSSLPSRWWEVSPAACKTTPSAALRARPLARSLPTLRATVRSRVPSSAQAQASSATTRASATDTLTAALSRPQVSCIRAIGAVRPGGPLCFRGRGTPARPEKGTTCSRRS